MSKNAEKKNNEKFDDLLNDVKEKKEKNKSKNKEDSTVNVNGDGDVKGDSNINSNDDIINDIDKISKNKFGFNSNSDSKNDAKPNIRLSKEKKEPEKIKRTYYIYEAEDKKLNELARKTNRDKSELIRIAINFLYENAETE